ncbi:IS481 family transposase [Roseiarcaceae bacterium H3SJ34-1]|uniref:IS481 family transposase n=1 Tax=Terripilifer ovatus TaxID=3032367 RepID=UPI003AB964CA|nr:IS481 family transposase [Roseiarcaceae bacterium H3SJ34-1]
MGQVLHKRATTTEATRRAIQNSSESLRKLAERYGIDPKTVAKWKKRSSVSDLPTGPKVARSTVLSLEEEAVIVAFRRHTLLPLDDCLYALQPTIKHLTRSSLHRCLLRHGISRLEIAGEKKPIKKKPFKSYPIGYFHIDLAEVQTAQGKLYLFVAIDRISKIAFTELHDKSGKKLVAQFLRNLVETVAYKIHIVLTDNGIQFTNRKRDYKATEHIFDQVCREHNIQHRLTRLNHPWTNGQVERMNRTVKDATVKAYHYDDHDQLRRHLSNFVDAYNFARRLKTLKGLTPYEFVCKSWTAEPERFRISPLHKMMGPNTYSPRICITHRR